MPDQNSFIVSFIVPPCFDGSRTLTKLKSQSQKRFNERKYQYLKYKNKNHSGTDT